MIMTQDKIIDRDALQDNMIQQILDDMDIKTMMAILEYIKANNSKFGNCLIINLAEMNSSEVAEESIMSESSK